MTATDETTWLIECGQCHLLYRENGPAAESPTCPHQARGDRFPVGTLARCDRKDERRPEVAIAALPKGAARLLDAAKASGWLWALAWSEDTGGSAFVHMVLGFGTPQVGKNEIEATWHTRGTGTPRLFNCLARGDGRGWHSVGLQDMLAIVAAHEAPAGGEQPCATSSTSTDG